MIFGICFASKTNEELRCLSSWILQQNQVVSGFVTINNQSEEEFEMDQIGTVGLTGKEIKKPQISTPLGVQVLLKL